MAQFLLILLLPTALLIGFSGCSQTLEPGGLPANHPANPAAGESQLPPRSQTLSLTAATQPNDPPLKTRSPDAHSGHASQSGGGMTRMSHPPAATRPATAPAAYVCPMHPEVTSAQPDKCPKCGMKLVPTEGKQ